MCIADSCDPKEIAITKFQNHPSILAIKDLSVEKFFDFSGAETNDI